MVENLARADLFSHVEANNYVSRGEKILLHEYAYNKGADQPGHPRSLIINFIVHGLGRHYVNVSVLS